MEKKATKHMLSQKDAFIEFIIRYVEKNECMPTYREIGDAMNLKSSSSVFALMDKLTRMGVIETFGDGRPRTFRLCGYKMKLIKEA